MKFKTFTIVQSFFVILSAIFSIISFFMDKIPAYMTVISITSFIFLMIILIILIKYITNKATLIKNIEEKDLLIKELSKHLPFISQCEKLGITYAYSQGKYDKNEEIKQKIRNAIRIDLFFTTGQGAFDAFQSVIIDAMEKNNAEIRAMVAKKNSPFLNSVGNIEKEYGYRDENREINLEIDTVEGFIHDYRRRANNHGSIELKHFETEFRTSMILIETHTEKWGLITLTTPPLKAVDSIAFTVNDTENENTVYKQCKKHFNCVWETLST